jgi:hypothetical protein
LAVVTDANPTGIAASWLRDRRLRDPRATSDWPSVEPHGDADGVAIWMDSHIAIWIAGTGAHMEWRSAMLDADELAVAVDAFNAPAGRFAPAE